MNAESPATSMKATVSRRRATVLGLDAKYKYKPENWQHALLTVGGEWLYLNKRVTDTTGVTLGDMVAPDGSRSLTVIHPDDRDAVDQALAHSIETGASFVRRYRQRRSNGAHRWVESRAEPRDESLVALLVD